jgi:MFS family permease
MTIEQGRSDFDIERNGNQSGPYPYVVDNAVDPIPATPPRRTAFEMEVPSTSSPPVNIKNNNNNNNKKKKDPDSERYFLQKIDGIVYLSYFCNVLAVNLPIILLPLAASEGAKAAETVNGSSSSLATIVATVSSMTTLGGAVGKFISGFVCQRWGPYQCSKIYLLGVAFCSGLFSVSTTPTTWGLACAGMEFCSSIQWTSLAIMLSSYYSKSSPTKLAAGLTAMGISSPAGAIVAKTMGAALASFMPWWMVARLGCLVAMLGSYVISRAPIQPFQQDSMDMLQKKFSARPMGSWITRGVVGSAARALLTSKLFWMLSVAHSMAFVVRGIDRILGTFFSDMTGLPRTYIPTPVAAGHIPVLCVCNVA